jgi:hypothetical protein
MIGETSLSAEQTASSRCTQSSSSDARLKRLRNATTSSGLQGLIELADTGDIRETWGDTHATSRLPKRLDASIISSRLRQIELGAKRARAKTRKHSRDITPKGPSDRPQ